MSDSLRQPTSLPRPWDSPGKNTGVGCHFLLWCMKVKSESEVAQSCPTLCDLMDCSPPGSFVHGMLQARVLEWVAITFSFKMYNKVYSVIPNVFIFLSVPLHLKYFPRRANEKLPKLVMFRKGKSRRRDVRREFHIHFYIFRHYSSL